MPELITPPLVPFESVVGDRPAAPARPWREVPAKTHVAVDRGRAGRTVKALPGLVLNGVTLTLVVLGVLAIISLALIPAAFAGVVLLLAALAPLVVVALAVFLSGDVETPRKPAGSR